MKYILLGFLLVTCLSTQAHGDLSLRIELKTKEISKNPNNPALYLERGYLHQQHEDYTLALKDYDKSESLGNKSNELYYRKAEANYLNKHFTNALQFINICFNIDSKDIKTYKLKAQILIEFKRYNEALDLYSYVIEKTVDLRPFNILEYCNMILTKDSNDYKKAINAIDVGLEKLGTNTFSLQLKKLEYLQASKQINVAINQFNYFIINNKRKEYWYYKKAKYLAENNMFKASNIALHQAKTTISLLDQKFKNTSSNKKLLANINELELNLSK